jgi:hypothetical protein
MRLAIAFVLTATLLAGANFNDVKYLSPRDGEKAKAVDGSLTVENGVLAFEGKGESWVVAKVQITNLVYERASRPRYKTGLLLAWPLLFTKGKKHFLTIQHGGEYKIMQLDKGNFRDALAAVEATTGVKVERLEEN